MSLQSKVCSTRGRYCSTAWRCPRFPRLWLTSALFVFKTKTDLLWKRSRFLQQVSVVTSAPDRQQSWQLIMIVLIMDPKSQEFAARASDIRQKWSQGNLTFSAWQFQKWSNTHLSIISKTLFSFEKIWKFLCYCPMPISYKIQKKQIISYQLSKSDQRSLNLYTLRRGISASKHWLLLHVTVPGESHHVPQHQSATDSFWYQKMCSNMS